MKFGIKLATLSKKKINRELVYNKKYLKLEKKINTKEGFNCICKQVILIDSVYKICIILKNYYPEAFSKKYNFNKDKNLY